MFLSKPRLEAELDTEAENTERPGKKSPCLAIGATGGALAATTPAPAQARSRLPTGDVKGVIKPPSFLTIDRSAATTESVRDPLLQVRLSVILRTPTGSPGRDSRTLSPALHSLAP